MQRHEELLGIALEIFMERGFERTTVEEIANRVGMSKRTVYARYESKDALFKATVMRAIEFYTVPYEAIIAVATDDLEQTLRAVAHQRIRNLTTPNSVRLQRVLERAGLPLPGAGASRVRSGDRARHAIPAASSSSTTPRSVTSRSANLGGQPARSSAWLSAPSLA